MCLAIPGRIMEFVDEPNRLAMVDVAGVQRTVNVGLLDADDLPAFRCPTCQTADVTVLSGEELEVEVESIEIVVLNVMSAPGAGKTTLLERVLNSPPPPLGDLRVGVLEGDVQGSLDADRLAHLHIPVTQLNTGSGFGGECHLDANMVRSALPSVPLDDIDLLIVENVGNLVCPAEFQIGEDARMMVASVAEGDDKPGKYPLMFRTCELVVVNKIDLLEHTDFSMDRFDSFLDAVHPDVERMRLSARTGEGVEAFRDWLARLPERAPAPA